VIPLLLPIKELLQITITFVEYPSIRERLQLVRAGLFIGKDLAVASISRTRSQLVRAGLVSLKIAPVPQ
jgi:hypothetical protein